MNPVPRGCGKTAYASRKDADKAMRSLIARKGRARSDQGGHAYHCRVCGEFHIGHKPRGRSPVGAA